MHSFIYLASQSPRRQELLQQIGVTFELLLADATEDAESLEAQIAGESALSYVQRVTLAKVTAALKRLQKRHLAWAPILCADTTVAIVIDGKETILGKPEDEADAKRILKLLSGKTHQVHTAIAVLGSENEPPKQLVSTSSVTFKQLVSTSSVTFKQLVSTSSVTFKQLDESEIDAYVASQEPMGKAGAYGIQGIAGSFVGHISGSFSSIMGLPLYETAQLLQETGVKFSINQ